MGRLLLICLLLNTHFLQAGDTLSVVRNLSYEKKFSEAADILAQYEKNSAGNTDAMRLHGILLYWSGRFGAASAYYQNKVQEKGSPLMLDFGRMLFELNKMDSAYKVISWYAGADTTNDEAALMLAKMEYWNGKPGKAMQIAEKIVKRNKSDKGATELLNEINIASSPYLKADAGYYTDDQPLKAIRTVVEAGWYRSALLQPFAQLQLHNIRHEGKWSHAVSFTMGNKLYITRSGTEIRIALGFSLLPDYSKTVSWIGSVAWKQQLYKNLYLEAGAEHKPYFITLSSVSNSLMQYSFNAGLQWGKGDMTYTNDFWKQWTNPAAWQARGVFNYQLYPDNNHQVSAYAWLLTPAVKVRWFELHAGYSYSYANTKSSRFAARQSLSEILSGYQINQVILGIYFPYFTPLHQHIHAVLGKLVIKPVKQIQITLSASVGVYAYADNPYLYLDNGNNGTFINQGAVKRKYTPYDLKASLDYTLSEKVSVGIAYTYQKAFFFNSHFANAGVKINFIHERR